MISLVHLSITFNKGESTETKALADVSLQLEKGDFAVIIGSNGSGKSTLLNGIAGTALPDKGTIYIDGADITRWPDYKRAIYISRVFQNPLTGTAPALSIIDNFRLAALRTGRKKLQTGITKNFKNEVKEKISILSMGLENDLYRTMGSLSGGQRQALTIIMGIMDHCSIMLLDEPVAALDPRSSELVMKKADEVIRQFNLTALMVTHHLKDAVTYGNKLFIMNEGRVGSAFNADEKRKITLDDLFSIFQ